MLQKEADGKVRHKMHKVQLLFHSTSNETDFPLFNLRTAQYMKYISKKRKWFRVPTLSLGLRVPARFSKSLSASHFLVPSQSSPAGSCGNVGGNGPEMTYP